ncbi:hypothetical protein HZB07_02280 [Candidatus Saganbacteria bacterium]|nr:hypothetical protein [Candidatus Saganbacteria bacterium]
MIRVPGSGPFIPPPINPKEGKKVSEETLPQTKAPVSSQTSIGRGPEMDARAIAVRLAALATEAKEKEISTKDFERILEEVINLTGLKDPQAALEEANRKLQHEIDLELERIKENKDLMDEADSWQKFGEILASINAEQAQAFVEMFQTEIRAL